MPGYGPCLERPAQARPAADAVRLVEAGQAAGCGRRLHGDIADLCVYHQGGPRDAAPAAGCRRASHESSPGRQAGLAPVSRATSAASSSA